VADLLAEAKALLALCDGPRADLEDMIAALVARLERAERIEATRVYWLIERSRAGRTEWWCGRRYVWVTDAFEATRFCRERDARDIIEWTLHGRDGLVATEHMDVPPAALRAALEAK
jgi:hypothetical protein